MNKSLSELDITNQCVLVCDLGLWKDESSASWTLLSGSQEEVGKKLAGLFEHHEITRLDDFGGVCETFLCHEDRYLENPPKVKAGGAVFSFTPKKRLLSEASEMARVSAHSGYSLMVLTLQKHDKFGKVWVLLGALRHLSTGPLTYFEDTNTVVDELKGSSEADKLCGVHVLSPGFEGYTSRLADRVISQAEYRKEVLL